MELLKKMGWQPASLPISADDVVEFHAARLLLLLKYCGVSGRIDGLTKMAKLDFFVRYPDFFDAAVAATPQEDKPESFVAEGTNQSIESAMVRHHYGPWDKRYYHTLAYLEAKGLISVTKDNRTFKLILTDLGQESVGLLSKRQSFLPIIERMRKVKKAYGNRTGSSLKKMIYDLFESEVRNRPMGEVIQK
ncbi:MAG: hypothetical protein KKC30_15750 [Proteobacteria bacterium]|nr:hypothetical protein [Pseudomonadota bacterium]MBU4381587.1 hypothetical protein [Pseudomonadota bacterium]MCG2766573.1 hypothetical protein [Desulfarculaceae bacterium]